MKCPIVDHVLSSVQNEVTIALLLTMSIVMSGMKDQVMPIVDMSVLELLAIENVQRNCQPVSFIDAYNEAVWLFEIDLWLANLILLVVELVCIFQQLSPVSINFIFHEAKFKGLAHSHGANLNREQEAQLSQCDVLARGLIAPMRAKYIRLDLEGVILFPMVYMSYMRIDAAFFDISLRPFETWRVCVNRGAELKSL